MESKARMISDETIYWIKLVITIIFGVSTVYLALYWSFYVMVLLYLVFSFAIPFIVVKIKTGESIQFCFKKSLKFIGTQSILYFLLLGIIFMINIGVGI